MNNKVIGKAKVSKNMTIAIIGRVRPWLDVRPGDHIVFIQDEHGRIVVEREMVKT
jgi:hypothetical protein